MRTMIPPPAAPRGRRRANWVTDRTPPGRGTSVTALSSSWRTIGAYQCRGEKRAAQGPRAGTREAGATGADGGGAVGPEVRGGGVSGGGPPPPEINRGYATFPPPPLPVGDSRVQPGIEQVD